MGLRELIIAKPCPLLIEKYFKWDLENLFASSIATRPLVVNTAEIAQISLLRVLSALDPIKVSLNIRGTGLAELNIKSAYASLKKVALEIEIQSKEYSKSE